MTFCDPTHQFVPDISFRGGKRKSILHFSFLLFLVKRTVFGIICEQQLDRLLWHLAQNLEDSNLIFSENVSCGRNEQHLCHQIINSSGVESNSEQHIEGTGIINIYVVIYIVKMTSVIHFSPQPMCHLRCWLVTPTSQFLFLSQNQIHRFPPVSSVMQSNN